jgi:hypothetical protein
MKTTFAVVGMFLALGFSLIFTGVAAADDDGSAVPRRQRESVAGGQWPVGATRGRNWLRVTRI